MKPPIPIADDYPGIARRLKEIEQENRRPLKLQFPENVVIVVYGSRQHDALAKLATSQIAKYELCFILRNKDLKLVKSRTGNFMTTDGFDAFAYLKQHFPSASPIRTVDSAVVRFSEDDARKLTELLQDMT